MKDRVHDQRVQAGALSFRPAVRETREPVGIGIATEQAKDWHLAARNAHVASRPSPSGRA